MARHAQSGNERDPVLARMREVIRSGGSLLIDQLGEDELEAMQKMLFDDEAEIISSACRPYLVAKLDRTII